LRMARETPNWGYRRRAPSARRAARAQVLLDLSASRLARIVGDWEATVRALRCLPVAADALAGLGMAGAEMVPVVVADNRGAAGGRPDVLTLVPGRRGRRRQRRQRGLASMPVARVWPFSPNTSSDSAS
jgi:hypothetical protein